MNDSQAENDAARERYEKASAFVMANLARIGKGAKKLLRDDNGSPIPFVLLIPTTHGTQSLGNIGGDSLYYAMRDAFAGMQAVAMRATFDENQVANITDAELAAMVASTFDAVFGIVNALVENGASSSAVLVGGLPGASSEPGEPGPNGSIH